MNNSQKSDAIQVVQCKSAEDLLSQISLRKRGYHNEIERLIFRGQANSDWDLLPSAFRSKKDNSGSWTNRDQIRWEYDKIKAFFHSLNEAGYRIPQGASVYEYVFPEYLSRTLDFRSQIERGDEPWPKRPFYQLIAMAQHYGLPTRFLDWSYDPMVAAYFAARSCIRHFREGNEFNEIAIYSLSTLLLEGIESDEPEDAGEALIKRHLNISAEKILITKSFRHLLNTIPISLNNAGFQSPTLKRNSIQMVTSTPSH